MEAINTTVHAIISEYFNSSCPTVRAHLKRKVDDLVGLFDSLGAFLDVIDERKERLATLKFYLVRLGHV